MTEVVPADPWLYSLLDVESCVIYGGLDGDEHYSFDSLNCNERSLRLIDSPRNCVMAFHGVVSDFPYVGEGSGNSSAQEVVESLAAHGLEAVGQEVAGARVVVSSAVQFRREAQLFLTRSRLTRSKRKTGTPCE